MNNENKNRTIYIGNEKTGEIDIFMSDDETDRNFWLEEMQKILDIYKKKFFKKLLKEG